MVEAEYFIIQPAITIADYTVSTNIVSSKRSCSWIELEESTEGQIAAHRAVTMSSCLYCTTRGIWIESPGLTGDRHALYLLICIVSMGPFWCLSTQTWRLT
jgi:hypothetical protein